MGWRAAQSVDGPSKGFSAAQENISNPTFSPKSWCQCFDHMMKPPECLLCSPRALGNPSLTRVISWHLPHSSELHLVVSSVRETGVRPVTEQVPKQEPWPCDSGLWPQDPGLSAADMSSTWIPHRQADFEMQNPGGSFSVPSRLLCRVLRCSRGTSLVFLSRLSPLTFCL